eukprot:scaffold14538_cov100-Amphora_coffeaeformis.AAC.1
MVSVTLEVAEEGGASVGGNKEAEADVEKNLLDPEPNKKAKTGPGQVKLLHFMGVTVGHDSLDTRHVLPSCHCGQCMRENHRKEIILSCESNILQMKICFPCDVRTDAVRSGRSS